MSPQEGPRRLEEGHYQALDPPKRAITGVNLLNSVGEFVRSVPLRFEHPTQWCPCPLNMEQDPEDSTGEKCRIACPLPYTIPDQDGNCICNPDPARHLLLTEVPDEKGVRPCKPGYEDPDGDGECLLISV